MRTPWGASQDQAVIAPGITFYSTAGHGGLKISKELNARVPDYFKGDSLKDAGWYEEDVDASIVIVAFPEKFSADQFEQAKAALKRWRPLQYELFFGETLEPGESKIKDQWQFNIDHENDFITISASGDWADWVPENYVGVTASRGGRRADWKVHGEVRCYLVPKWEYAGEHPFGFVIDESRHERVECPPR